MDCSINYCKNIKSNQYFNLNLQEEDYLSPIKANNYLSVVNSLKCTETLPLFFALEKTHHFGTETLKRKSEKITEEEKIDRNPQVRNHQTLFAELTERDIQQFTYQEPLQWCQMSRNSTGRIIMVIPHELQNIRELIYLFKNKEKDRYLIGKTGDTFKNRMSKYVSWFNQSKTKAKKPGRLSFIQDIRKHPEDFEVGILHQAQAQDLFNLEELETLFIACKRKVYDLYNDNEGGGGGLAHTAETPTTYAIPKPQTASYTPVKYYPYKKDEDGNTRLQLTPGVKSRIKELRKNMEDTQEFVYVIKKIDTEERYIGVSGDPEKRGQQHAYASEYFDPEHPKYDPDHGGGLLHPAIAENPELFGWGLLPIQSVESIPEDQRKNYVLLNSIAEVEKFSIQFKQSLFSQHGFNCTRGGEGPLSTIAKKSVVKKLYY